MKKKKKNLKEGGPLRKFWNYLWYDDSIGSYVLNFIVAFIFIKYLFFPSLGFVLNTDYPVVAIVSGSMEHKYAPKSDSYGRPLLNPDNTYTYFLCKDTYDKEKELFNFDESVDLREFWDVCGEYYEENFNLTLEEFDNFKFKKGLNIGDVMVLRGKSAENIEIGEVLVFKPQSDAFFNNYGPVIHRVVDKWEEDGKIYFQTKGDHNGESFDNFENRISEDDVFGVGVVRIPYIGYAKLLLTRTYVTLTDFNNG